MNYLTEKARLTAFQMRDPFAASAFFICNNRENLVCRTNCDVHNIDVKRSNLIFIDDINWALNNDYKPCEFSLPDYIIDKNSLTDNSFVSVDIELLIKTVTTVNCEIGFIPPMDFDIQYSNSPLNSSKSSAYLENADESDDSLNKSPVMSTTKNDYERLKLVDIACRHLALAAMTSISDINLIDDPINSKVAGDSSTTRGLFYFNEQSCKRKRGGVLGFKELAQKCKMSPWHFHRVFKSITNVTPKLYGDKCFNFIKNHEREFIKSFESCESIIISTRITGINDDQPPPVKRNSCYVTENNHNSLNQYPSFKKRNSVAQTLISNDRRNTITTIDTIDPMEPYLYSEPMRLTQSFTPSVNFVDDYLFDPHTVKPYIPANDTAPLGMFMSQAYNTPQPIPSTFNDNLQFSSNMFTTVDQSVQEQQLQQPQYTTQ